MGKQYEKKITWTIRNFSSLQSTEIYSDHFLVGGCKWRLLAYPRGNGVANYLSLFLDIADSGTLPLGWKRHAKFRLTVVNQLSEELSQLEESQQWFDQKSPSLGYPKMLPHTKLLDKNGSFLVNEEVKIVAEVDVLEVICKSDVLEETSSIVKTMDFNGFQVLPSQVESVKSLFEKHPNLASKLSLKNPQLRTTCFNVLLTLNEILCNSSKELSNGDLAYAYSALKYVTKAGFKLDWLEKKLKEASETRKHEIEEDLNDLKRKYSDMEALLEFLP